MVNKSLRFIIKLSLCIILCAVSVVSTFAWTDVGPFAYWYSDADGVGYIPGSTTYVYVKSNGSGLGSSNLNTYVTAAKNAWTSEGSFATGSSSNYDIIVQDIARANANLDGVTANTEAITYSTCTVVGRGTVSGTSLTKKAYSIISSETYLIYGGITNNYSSNKWKAIAAHEMGHALGYFGHDNNATSSSKSLMDPTSTNYWESWQVSAPTSRDLLHMRNI